jgi:hypothetical protein
MRIVCLNMLKGLDEPPHWDVVVWLILVALGPEFLSLDPRWAYNRTWRYGTPVDWLTCLDLSMSYLVRAFHLAYASKMFWNEMVEEVHTYRMWSGWRVLGCIKLDPLHTTNGSASKNGQSRDGRLKPFSVAHGIGRRKVKVVGGHYPTKILPEGPGDSRHVWVKLCTPAGLNLFKKPCPQLWTTWRQMLDHREL